MATYGSAEWAKQMYGNNSYKPPTQTQPPAQTTSQPSYYQQYIEKMKAQQAAQQAAMEERSRYETMARANEAQRLMMEKRQAAGQLGSMNGSQNSGMEYRDRDTLWYRMTQMPLNKSGIGSQVSNWWGGLQSQNNNANLAGRGTSGMWSNASGINQWTGLPYQNYGNLPLEAQYQYGLPTTKQDYINSMEQFRQNNFPLVMEGRQVRKLGLTEDQLNILREQRRGYQVGMPGIDGVTPPQVLGNPPTNNNGGGNSGFMFPDFGGYGGYGGGGGGWSFPSYGGGSYKPSETASKWYNTMVQWNIGNKQA